MRACPGQWRRREILGSLPAGGHEGSSIGAFRAGQFLGTIITGDRAIVTHTGLRVRFHRHLDEVTGRLRLVHFGCFVGAFAVIRRIGIGTGGRNDGRRCHDGGGTNQEQGGKHERPFAV